ncbi:MAG: class I SAM-dependent methyltransferase [Brevefilum sp.]
MNNELMYDEFSTDYDRFVNWKGRLDVELPFLKAELAVMKGQDDYRVRVLDAACGTGQHAIALAKNGFDVSGADISAKMIEIARKNAKTEKHDLHFKQAGFGQLTTAFGRHSFDGLICLGNSLPHVLEEGSMLDTLADFKSVLRPGGKLIIQNRNFDGIMGRRERWMQPETYVEGENTWIFVRFYDFDPDGLISFNILILTDLNKGGFTQKVISTRLWPFTHIQLINWLKHTGFGNIQLFGNLEGVPYSAESSSNLVITAHVS